MLRWLTTMTLMLGLCLSAAPGQAKGKELRHEVRSGETLSGIAIYYGCSVDQLKALNSLRSDNITLGARLLVPWPDVRLRKAARINVSVHQVLPGESLGVIANRYDADVRAIRLFNGIRGDNIKAGQQLKIPTLGPALHRSIEPYVVQPGDNLASIAKGHDVQPRHLRHLNHGVDFKALRAGQELKIYRWEVLGADGPKPTTEPVAPTAGEPTVDLDLTLDDEDDEVVEAPTVVKAKAVQVLKEQTAELTKGLGLEAKPTPAVKAEAKPVVKAEAKPVVKAEAKPVVKAEAKPVVKPEARKDKPDCKCTCHDHAKEAGAKKTAKDEDDFAYE